jgi:hypothetical protein
MANTIRIKRSTTTSAPSSLAEGELAYSELSGNLFIGTSSSTQTVIGGKEGIQDIIGGMVTGNTETGISVTYADNGVGLGKLNFALASSISVTNITGTLLSASQTNITSLGSLNGLTIASGQTISMGSNRVTNVTNPTQAQDAATKAYVDAVKTGLDIKDSVRVATTANGTLSTAFDNSSTVDGITLATDDRILIKNQTSGAENGIYVVQASGAPVRATDCDSSTEVTGGLFVFIEQGTVNADSGFVLSNDGAITVGTTSLSFVQFSGAGMVVAGAAMSKTGNTLDVTVDGSSIEVSGDDLQVKASGITNSMLAGSIDLTTKVTGTLPVGNGGSGLNTITAKALMYGNGTSAVSLTGVGTYDSTNSIGQILSVNSTGVPTWTNTIDGGAF